MTQADQITKLDVHALAALPGSGKAQAVLKAAGLWDEYAAGREREFAVSLEGEIQVYGEITVTARCEEEAGKIALQRAERGDVEWEIAGAAGCVSPMITDISDSDC